MTFLGYGLASAAFLKGHTVDFLLQINEITQGPIKDLLVEFNNVSLPGPAPAPEPPTFNVNFPEQVGDFAPHFQVTTGDINMPLSGDTGDINMPFSGNVGDINTPLSGDLSGDMPLSNNNLPLSGDTGDINLPLSGDISPNIGGGSGQSS